MAQPIQDPTVGSALQALFSLQGRVRPALEEFIIPTVRVADLSRGASPPLSRICSAAIAGIAAVVGELATVRFEVPPTLLAEILSIRYAFNAVGGLKISFPGNAAAVSGLGSTVLPTRQGLIDGRVANQAQPAAVITYGTQAGSLSPYQYFEQTWATNQTTHVDLPSGIVVGTGRSNYGFMEMQWNPANTQVAGLSIVWREFAVV